MPEPQKADPRQLRSGPIRNESLPPNLLERIQAIHRLIGRYLGMTLEEFEIGFMRDADPGQEVLLWSLIAATWRSYHAKFLAGQTLPDEEERKLLGAVLQISMGATDPAILGVTADIGASLLECYEGFRRR